MKRLVYILILILLFSCKKDDDGFKEYVVKAGDHYKSGWRLTPTTKKSLDFEFKTNSTWIWNDQYPEGVTGWSKIAGFSEGEHIENSCIILGYRYENGFMIVGGYGRADGVDASDDPLMDGYIDTLQMDSRYFVRIAREQGRYVIRINGKEWSCRAGKSFDWGFRLNPFVGGNYLIQHDWIVPIKWK